LVDAGRTGATPAKALKPWRRAKCCLGSCNARTSVRQTGGCHPQYDGGGGNATRCRRRLRAHPSSPLRRFVRPSCVRFDSVCSVPLFDDALRGRAAIRFSIRLEAPHASDSQHRCDRHMVCRPGANRVSHGSSDWGRENDGQVALRTKGDCSCTVSAAAASALGSLAHNISSNAHCCLVQTTPPPGCSFPCIINAQRPSVKSGNAEDCDRQSRVGLDDLGLLVRISLWSPGHRPRAGGPRETVSPASHVLSP